MTKINKKEVTSIAFAMLDCDGNIITGYSYLPDSNQPFTMLGALDDLLDMVRETKEE